MVYLYQQTDVAPTIVNQRYLWQSGIVQDGFPLPEVGTNPLAFSAALRAISRGLRGGDVLHLRQTLAIELDSSLPHKIDIDYRYFKPQYYCANYQPILDGVAVVGQGGYLNNAIGQNIITNNFTVQILNEFRPDEYLHLQNQYSMELSSCNWRLAPSLFPDPVAGTPVAGFELIPAEPNKPNGRIEGQNRFLWKGNTEAYPFPTIGSTGAWNEDIEILGHWGEVGFFLHEGISIVSISENIWCDYAMPILIPPTLFDNISLVPECGIAGPSCESQFDLFVQENPDVFLSASACAAVNGGPCGSFNWICPTDSSVTFPYWLTSPI